MILPTQSLSEFPTVGDVYLTSAGTIYTIMEDKIFSYVVCVEGSPGIQHEFDVPDTKIIEFINVTAVSWVYRFRPSVLWHLTNIREVTRRIADIDKVVGEMREENNKWSLLDVPIWATCLSPRVYEYTTPIEAFNILDPSAEPKKMVVFDMAVMQMVFREQEWLNKFCQENNATIDRLMGELYTLKTKFISYRGGGINPYSLIPEGDDEQRYNE